MAKPPREKLDTLPLEPERLERLRGLATPSAQSGRRPLASVPIALVNIDPQSRATPPRGQLASVPFDLVPDDPVPLAVPPARSPMPTFPFELTSEAAVPLTPEPAFELDGGGPWPPAARSGDRSPRRLRRARFARVDRPSESASVRGGRWWRVALLFVLWIAVAATA